MAPVPGSRSRRSFVYHRRPSGGNDMMRVLAVLLAVLLIGPAAADDYPTRPVQLMNPYPPGGVTDMMARVLATEMSQLLGRSVVVLNRDGAAGALGSSIVAAAKPDGYSLLFVPALVVTVQPAMRPKLTYNFDSF